MAIATSETVIGTTTGASSLSAASWTPSANDLILVWVACRAGITASGVSGNGITFTQVLSDTESPQNQCTLSLWRGMAASPATGQITATLSGTANAAVIVAHRISGADTSGTNGSGAIGASAIANTGATDTTAPSVGVTTTAANSRVYGGATHRAQSYTVGAGETAISLNNTAGTAGDVTSLSTEYQDVASASSVTINGTLASATDWIQGAVEVKAAPTTITGDASITLGAITGSADGSLAVQADATITIGALTTSADGSLALQGQASITLGALSTTSDGSLAIQGDANLTLGVLAVAADGGLTGITADANLTLGAFTVAATGALPIQADASLTLGALTATGAGTVALQGDASITLGAITLSADATRGISFYPYRRNTFRVAADTAARIPVVGRFFSVPAEPTGETV